ncbi:class I adenylate-forming enzyme family protein [Gordonia insulae]|uniref:Long-chain-fatty-acid--CoA ligase n=1 Tax=Gordonia insulae TaxID=2420509 RepID=A0A3G8JL69_9ACTN|nr:class I adenylate-forming enzyme family protein [Gordonia insulae]AZG45806.1 Long-chain-fatty-acid--CoA ligase [Gordonia insulae]
MTEAVVLAFEDEAFSARQLDAMADGFARELSALGVARGARVALMSSNRPEFVVAIRAIWRLRAAVVLISPAWKTTEVSHALDIAGVTHAVGDHPVLAGLMPMRDLGDTIEPTGVSAESGFDGPNASDDAVLVFSSGTTGMPKAVRHTHASLDAAVGHWRDALDLTAADRLQVLTPPSHILGLLNIVTALDVGAWVRLHRRFDIDTMLRHIESDRITVEMAVAPIALAMASHPRLEQYDLSSLRYIMWGATPVTSSVAEEVTRRTGIGWLPAYGASEIPVIATNPIDDARLDRVGRAVEGVEVRVVSLDTGAVLPPGHSGEIQLRAPSIMAGYLPDEENITAFADGWYRTGDVGAVDADGWIELIDRSKEMIKVRGFQVAPAEVEAVLHGHPAVADCAVFGVDDGVGGERIVAAVEIAEPVTGDELIELVANTLATYKKPSAVAFVDDVPRLPSGKVLRRVLKDRLSKESHGCTTDN